VAPAADANATAILAVFRTGSGVTAGIIGATLVFLTDQALAADRIDEEKVDQDQIRSLFAENAAARINAGLTAGAAADAEATRANNELLALVRLNRPAAIGWFFDLLMASKKKALTNENVSGYFLSISVADVNPGPIASFFNMIRGYFTDRITNAVYRDSASESKWMTYRMTRYSAGPAMVKIIPDLLQIRAISEATAVAIRAANAAPWDMALANAIPDASKGIAYIYYEAAGIELDDWVQGRKAADEFPAAVSKAYRTIFRKYFAIKVNMAGVEAAADMAALINLTQHSFAR